VPAEEARITFFSDFVIGRFLSITADVVDIDNS